MLDRLVELTAGQDLIKWVVPPAPEGLLAAARVDLPQVTAHLLDRLASENDRIRADAAAGAQALLEADATRVLALGPALVTSIRGTDRGYAGEPHPAGSAARALAEAWRREPATTAAVIESAAIDVPIEARAELVHVVRFLKRWREPLDVSTEAAEAATSFCTRRLGGDWGEQASDRAADELDNLAEDVPDLVLPHVQTLLGTLLMLCAEPEPSPLLSSPATGMAATMAELERESAQVSLKARRRTIARTVGRLTAHAPTTVLDPVLALFNATSRNEKQDRTVRVVLLGSLKEATSVALLRDLLPVLYSDCCPPTRLCGPPLSICVPDVCGLVATRSRKT